MSWRAERGLDPLTAHRPHLEPYIRWMQEVRHFKPSTVSRRWSVAAGFCKTCVIDGLLERSPADHVRRPSVPPESPTFPFAGCPPGRGADAPLVVTPVGGTVGDITGRNRGRQR
jgi:hypothetical protein